MNNLTIIEKEGQRVLTTQQLAELYDSDEKIILRNFQRNRDKYKEGVHYFSLTGQELQDFKGSRQNDVTLKYVSVIYLWTEKGALLHAKSLNTEKAWDVYQTLIDCYFRIKEKKPACIEDVLIKSLEEMKNVRLQVWEAKQETAAVKEEVQDIRDTLTVLPGENWRAYVNKLLNKIGTILNDYKTPKDDSYKVLEQRGRCELMIRLNNMRMRALSKGTAKSKVDEFNYLDVIEEEPRLKEIYISIVREMAIKNGIDVRH